MILKLKLIKIFLSAPVVKLDDPFIVGFFEDISLGFDMGNLVPQKHLKNVNNLEIKESLLPLSYSKFSVRNIFRYLSS